MEKDDIHQKLIRSLGVRVGDESADYLSRQTSVSPAPVSLHVYGRDVRTGVARRLPVDPVSIQKPNPSHVKE